MKFDSFKSDAVVYTPVELLVRWWYRVFRPLTGNAGDELQRPQNTERPQRFDVERLQFERRQERADEPTHGTHRLTPWMKTPSFYERTPPPCRRQ